MPITGTVVNNPVTVAGEVDDRPAVSGVTSLSSIISSGAIIGRPLIAGVVQIVSGGVSGPELNVQEAPYNAQGDGATDDTAAIQAAIDDAYELGGGCVLLPAGDYLVSTLKMRSYVTLRGVSRAAAYLVLKANTNGNVIELFDARQEQIQLRDFTIEGRKSQQSAGHGIYILNDPATNGVFASGLLNPHHFIDNLVILNCKQDGLHMAGDTLSGECHLSNVFAYACDRFGFYALTPDCNWYACITGQSGSQGFYLESPNSRYTGCKAWFSGRLDANNGDGFYLTSGQRQELTGCESQDNKRHGFVFKDTKYAITTGCVADSNGTGVEGVGFRFDNAQRCMAKGMSYDRVTGSETQKYHVIFDNGSEANMVDLVCGPWASGGAMINGAVGDNTVRLHQAGVSGVSLNQYRASVVLGHNALATNATEGFLYLCSMAGVPSGTPTSYTGTVPMVVDSSNSKLMAYIGGSWKGVTLS